MNLKTEHKQYILEHEKDIRENNWEKFFEDRKYPHGIGEPLYLANIQFMGGLKRVPEFSFRDCTSLTSITIPDGVTSIEDCAFWGCRSLSRLTLAKGSALTSIGNYAFSNCSSLESITVEGGNAEYHSAGNCLIETASKTLVLGCKNSVIPTDGSVTSIGSCAFHGCTDLTSITIPNSVTSIGYWAFYDCTGLTSITLPASVAKIEGDAFYKCSNLTNITYEGTKAQWKQIYNKDAFTDVYFTVNCTDGQIVKK